MHFNLPDFLNKLWDRGIDIAVNTISALLVTGIVSLFWGRKKKRELELDRERLKIHKEQDEIDQQFQWREGISKLVKSRAGFVDRVSAIKSGDELNAAWLAFGLWLNSEGLSNVLGNHRIFEKWRGHDNFVAVPIPDNAIRFARMVAADIAAIRIPDETELSKRAAN